MEVPEHIDVDVSAHGDGRHAAADRSAGARRRDLLDDPEETVIATLTMPTREVEPEEAGRRSERRPRARRACAEGEGGARGRCGGTGRRRGLGEPAPTEGLVALLPSGRRRLDARPARRRPRQPRPRARGEPSQRRLDGRRRARAPPRRSFRGKYSASSPRRGSTTRGRAAQAGDVHEPVGAVGRAGRALLQGRARARCSSSTTRATSTSVGCRRGRRRPRRPQRPPLDRAAARHAGVPAAADRRRPAERGDPRPLADYVLSDFEPHDDAEAIVARAADAVEKIPRRSRGAAALPRNVAGVAGPPWRR